jgi:arylsulfatase A-like enzyme
MKQYLLPVFILTALLLPATGALSAADVPKPNIVLIFIDDMGYADIGPFGNTKVRTPHLDRMATEGMKFTSFYAAPVCSMSRACLMTGCYNARVSIPGVLFPRDKIGLHPNEITLAEIVKPKGYATACIGKWHLGSLPRFLPTRQGFDYYFGLPYSNDMGTGNRKHHFPPLPLIRNETTIETEPNQSQFTKRYTTEAVKFIRAHKDGPFFVYLPHTMIHNPLAASAAFKGKSKLGRLGDAIEEIDWSVGEILRTLKELKLDEQTLVIFTSDNGPGNRGAPPFRGFKGSNYEGGVREPCLMRWPGQIPAGTACRQIAGNIDMLPTFAKLVGGELPRDRVIDGRDITSLMFDPQAGPVRDTQLYFSHLKVKRGRQLEAIRQGNWKLFVGGTAKGALYDLAKDPGEKTNVAAANPEIVSRLRAEAKRREAEILRNKRPHGTANSADGQISKPADKKS